MLHEILLALLGHTGSIFLKQHHTLDDINDLTHSDTHLSFFVNPSLAFLSPAEKHQLNALIELGAMYKQIQLFLDKYSGINSKLALQVALGRTQPHFVDRDHHSDDGHSLEEDPELVVGVYVKAFCSGVTDLLKVYKQNLLALEQAYLNERSLTVTSLQLKLQLYF